MGRECSGAFERKCVYAVYWPAVGRVRPRPCCGAWVVPVHGGCVEREKGIRWMPWHQEAMKDVARCEKPRGAASGR